MNTDGQEKERLLRNWRAEHDSAELYAALARFERDPRQRGVYLELASSERRHAAFWEQQLRGAGHVLPVLRRSLRTAFLIFLARRFGSAFVVPSIVTREMKDRDDYAAQEDAQAAGLALDEHAHADILRGGSDVALGTNLRAALLGVNDGLASNFCLLMGVAGGGVSPAATLLTGTVGLLGGACSMALGEWLSVTNARELALSQLDPALDARQREQHPSVASVGSAASAATFSFVLFACGALVPLLPFCLLPLPWRVAGSIALSVTALFVVGLSSSLFNARPAVFSGLRQTVIGAVAAAVTYAAGRLVGVLAGL
jgi:VIT1/CCC1 family predicted Fe2+/Mn2+ transporter